MQCSVDGTPAIGSSVSDAAAAAPNSCRATLDGPCNVRRRQNAVPAHCCSDNVRS